jgi:hypothetical protein
MACTMPLSTRSGLRRTRALCSPCTGSGFWFRLHWRYAPISCASDPPWFLASAVTVIAGTLGAYTGWVAGLPTAAPFVHVFTLYAALFLACCVALPFVQAWSRRGTLSGAYPDLFECAWHDAILLVEAALFTGLFWALLALWGALFKVIGITFFVDLFVEPAFAYPITAIVFGYALHLINANERIVVALRGHLLGVFNWLLPLVALIAVIFLAALPFTGLQPLWDTGHATALMLVLQVLFIKFVNAAFGDGQNEPRYPGWLKIALRAAVLSLPVYAALCTYSLGLRIAQHGWTVSRIWAAAATLVIAIYGIGYAASALRWRGRWMAGMAQVNIAMAFVIVGVLFLLNGPALDPRRLSAESQLARLHSGTISVKRFDYDYLRFNLGRYGLDALARLAKDADNDVSALASAALARQRHYGDGTATAAVIASRIELKPDGAVLDPAFIKYLEDALNARQAGEHPQHPFCLTHPHTEMCLMLALDLNGDGEPEMLALNSYPQVVYSKSGGQWNNVGMLSGGKNLTSRQFRDLINDSRFGAKARLWSDVCIGDACYTVLPTRVEGSTSPASAGRN